MKNVNQTIVETFREVAEYLETGRSGRRPRLLLTGMGSEHGEENSMQAAVMAARVGLDVSYIGTLEGEGVTTVPVADEEAGHRKMVELLESGAADAAVTMHFPFPIGVSTVGRVVTPARGKSMFLATTTGTSSANRMEGMILNTIYGIITAKACGIQEPTVGILNVDGARACETALRQLQQAGYPIRFAESVRADGGAVMRGNDVLQGTPDVMVCDSLTGNVLIKMLSSFTTGGSFESTGYGYGPGIGRDYDKLVLIISRASGAPLIANALSFADELVRGGVQKIAKAEFALADKAGLEELLRQKREASAPAAAKAEVRLPPRSPAPQVSPASRSWTSRPPCRCCGPRISMQSPLWAALVRWCWSAMPTRKRPRPCCGRPATSAEALTEAAVSATMEVPHKTQEVGPCGIRSLWRWLCWASAPCCVWN